MKTRAPEWGVNIADRIRWLAAHRTKTLKEISTQAGFSENYVAIAVSRMRRDPANRDIGSKLILGIAKATDCDAGWLLTGDGEPFPHRHSDIRPSNPLMNVARPVGEFAPMPLRKRGSKR